MSRDAARYAHGLNSGPRVRVLVPTGGALVQLQPDVPLLPVRHPGDRVVRPARYAQAQMQSVKTLSPAAGLLCNLLS